MFLNLVYEEVRLKPIHKNRNLNNAELVIAALNFSLLACMLPLVIFDGLRAQIGIGLLLVDLFGVMFFLNFLVFLQKRIREMGIKIFIALIALVLGGNVSLLFLWVDIVQKINTVFEIKIIVSVFLSLALMGAIYFQIIYLLSYLRRK